MEQDVGTRIAVIEKTLDHHEDAIEDLKAATAERLMIQQKMLDELRQDQRQMRNDMGAGFDRLQNAIETLTRDALNSQPAWAAENATRMADQARSDAKTKGILYGVAASLLATITFLVVTIALHINIQ